MLQLIAIFFLMISYSQNEKPVIIKGFDNTYIVTPGNKKWNKVDSLDTNSFKRFPTRYEYTNFEGETIDLTTKKRIYVSKKDDLISTMNFVNDPAKDHYDLYFKLREKVKVMIQVYTTDNVRISDLYWEVYEKGMNKVNIEKRYYEGVYVIYLTIDDRVFKHRVLFN